MQATLITLGIVAVMAAIVGGGLKAFGVEVGVVGSLGRQLLLAVFGLAVVAFGLWEPWNRPPDDGQGEPGSVEVPVSATQGWTDTRVDLAAGDQLTIEADGQINDDVNNHPTRVFGPEGQPDVEREHPGDPHRDMNHAALIARIGSDGEVFEVGVSLRCTVARTGRLMLGLNDGRFDDNDGQYVAEVLVASGGASAPAPMCGS